MAKKWVYLFKEGNGSMRELLGGKGANLAEMTNLGLPVPQGFTITTEACTQYYEDGRKINDEIVAEIMENIDKMEEITGKKFGDLERPLLVSVRSGARASMPGMMDTILNLGLNEDVVKVMAEKSGNERWAYDCYRRFIQMYSDVVMEVGKKYFEELIDKMKEDRGVTQDTELTAADLKELAEQFKAEYKAKIGEDFPSDPKEQLMGAVKAVFRSWDNPRANVYRRDNDIPYSWGTAVNVQAMAFGNMGDNCGTPAVRDIVVHTIDVRTGVVPRTEYCLDCFEELFFGIGGEILADLVLVLGLELGSQFLQVVSGQLNVLLDALLFLHLVDEDLEVLLADFHNDVGVHLDETTVAVVGPTGVAGLGSQNLNDFLVQTQVQDGIHHAGHGSAGAGTNGNQQGVFLVTELLAGDGLQLLDVVHDLSLDVRIDLLAVLVVLGAGLSGNGEALGHRQTDVGHLGQVSALAAQQLAHGAIALGEKVDKLLRHGKHSFSAFAWRFLSSCSEKPETVFRFLTDPAITTMYYTVSFEFLQDGIAGFPDYFGEIPV